jgi:chromosome partitioning protein
MKTVAFAGTKGGVGKTTLAFNIACEAAKHGTVFLADMDPQKSFETFAELRGGDNPLLLKNVQSIPRAIADLTRTGFLRNFLVVDTPGSFMNVIRDTARAAGCIVVPMQPSPIDVLAQEDMVSLVRGLGKAAQMLPVLNRVDSRGNLDDARRRITALFAASPILVKNRSAYARALAAGKAAPELDKEAAEEIASLWAAIQTVWEGDNAKPRHL